MGLMRHLNDVVNKTWNYSGKVKDNKDAMMNAVLGLAGEAGEVADFHKKFFYHKDKANDMAKAREELLLELGDVSYYLVKVIDLWGFTVKEVLEANKNKLTKRHPECFKETK